MQRPLSDGGAMAFCAEAGKLVAAHMDVRCEKCMTVYELEDARVGDAGLTVKCEECGNLFKVRRRSTTAELVVGGGAGAGAGSAGGGGAAAVDRSGVLPESESDVELAAVPLAGVGGAEPMTAETTAASIRARIDGKPEAATSWLLRSSVTGDVQRFRELTTLQQWIVERKVGREDEISRGGESWKPLGGIAELASFFHVVEQAESVARATQPGRALRSANQLGGLDSAQVDALTTGVVRELPVRDDRDDDRMTTTEAEAQRRSWRGPVVAIVLLSGLGAGGWLWWQHQRTRASSGAHEVAAELEKASAALAIDTDDGYREAIATLEPVVTQAAHRTNSERARVLLGEAHVRWGTAMIEDAHDVEQTGAAAAARTMRAEAKGHFERARRVLEEQPGAEAAVPLALAFADLARAEGAPFDSVDKYLQRARTDMALGAPHAFLPLVEGELALRDGKAAEAQAHFAEASRLAHDEGHELARADFRLAQLAATEGRTDDQRHACAELLRISPQHERGRALCTKPVAVDASVAAPAEPDASVAKVMVPTVAAPAGDYRSLVHDGDRLAESGRSQQARKLYERALELDSKGVGALVGLGYCDLDAERYMNAVDRFDAALAIEPDSGDAMLGLAESYKVRGRTAQAIEFYRKYLATHAGGSKAAMAQNNLRELEPRTGETSVPVPDRVIIKPKPDNDSPTETTLPRLPSDAPPP